MREKSYTIAEETRKRCKIVSINERVASSIRPMNLELFDYLYESPKIDFSIYFKIGPDLVEFITPEQFSAELLEKLKRANLHPKAETGVFLAKKEYPKFEATINEIRLKKLQHLAYNHPELDRKTLQVYSQISSASQMIVEGGISAEVTERVQRAAAVAISEVLDNPASAGTISRMVNIDSTLYDHSASVAMFAGVIADKHLKKKHRDKLTNRIIQAGLFHDVGKSCLPNHVLNKPGKLTDDEYEIIKKHPTFGFDELTAASGSGAYIEPLVARVALEHHEKFSGGGYPFNKRGKAEDDPENGIHIFTRIVTIADVYSALLMKRCYKSAMSSEDAIKMMREDGENHYDMDIFASFLQTVESSLEFVESKSTSKGRIIMVDDNEVLAEKLRKVI